MLLVVLVVLVLVGEGGNRNSKPVRLSCSCVGCWLLHPDTAPALRALCDGRSPPRSHHQRAKVIRTGRHLCFCCFCSHRCLWLCPNSGAASFKVRRPLCFRRVLRIQIRLPTNQWDGLDEPSLYFRVAYAKETMLGLLAHNKFLTFPQLHQLSVFLGGSDTSFSSLKLLPVVTHRPM